MMKFFMMAVLTTLVSFNSFAGCTVSIQAPRYSGMSVGFVGEKSLAKIVRMMEKKGYEVKSTSDEKNEADLNLLVSTSWGYGCGTGLTWVDYLLIPASFKVELSVNHGNVLFSRERDYVFPAITTEAFARRKLFRVIRQIPNCKE